MSQNDLDAIPPGMLSSPQIKTYLNHGFLINFPDDMDSNDKNDAINESLRAATYDMRLGTPALRFERGKRNDINLGINNNSTTQTVNKLTLPPNSLTFVATHESFNLPKDVIARFNLKVRWVHRGLLLGTGPIVDPQYSGPLFIPIHNFSSQFVDIKYLDSIISVEFTKTLSVQREKSYIDNKHKNGTIEEYVENTPQVESSVFKDIEDVKALNKKQERTLSLFRWGGVISIIAVLIGLATQFYTIKGLVNTVNARVDGIHAIYNAPKNDYENMLKNVEKIKNIFKDINSLNVIMYQNKKSYGNSNFVIDLGIAKQYFAPNIKSSENNK